jgi:hypothetical protein
MTSKRTTHTQHTQQPNYLLVTKQELELFNALNDVGIDNHIEFLIDRQPYRSNPSTEPSVDCFWKCEHGKRLQEEAVAQAREDVLKKAEHLAQTIPNFNRMDYIHLLKEAILAHRRRTPMSYKVTNHITPYGIQTKECETIEDAFDFIATNEKIISMATISKQKKKAGAP